MSSRAKLISGIGLLVLGLGLIGWNTMHDPDAALRAPKKERRVMLEEIPAAVQATVKRETAGGTVKEVEEKLQDGTKTYEIDILRGDYAIEVDIDANGKVLEREVKKKKKHGGASLSGRVGAAT
jgi:hypothetical protein